MSTKLRQLQNALNVNSVGYRNVALGFSALESNLSNSNVAVGAFALNSNITGAQNVAIGTKALYSNLGGHRNVAIGIISGYATTGNDNIYIAASGVAGENGQIKIGNPNHSQTFIEGISGNSAAGGIAVLINGSNELHTAVSSARFKEAVRDMGEASELLMQLRPVTFRYREKVDNGADIPEYGLIAEEVAEVAPELVAYDEEGEPYSVRYHVLPSLLVNEVQKQQAVIEQQQKVIAVLTDRLGRVEQLVGAPEGPIVIGDRH